jgi:hypothetical protein
MGTISMDLTISGGQVLRLDLSSKGGFVPQENSDVTIGAAVLHVDDKTKKGYFDFTLLEKKNEPPRKITVEDVTDDTPVTWAVDTQPELHNRVWDWNTHLFEPNEKNLPWIYQIENGVRVYRFTIVTKDGRTLVMYGAQSYTAQIKSYLRLLYGIDKPPPKTF